MYEKNEFFERYNKSNDLDFSTNITKKLFIVKYVFFYIKKIFANKIIKNFNDEVNNEIENDFEIICDVILNTTKNINTTNKINKINKTKKIKKINVLNFFAW